MSSVSVIWYLLKTKANIISVVPAARIMCGDLPLNTVLPAISVKQISSVPMNLLKTNEANKLHSDRIQVTALFKANYPGLKDFMKLILAACPSQRGTVNSVVVDSIQPELEGPDLYDHETDIYSQSRDFVVRWVGA